MTPQRYYFSCFLLARLVNQAALATTSTSINQGDASSASSQFYCQADKRYINQLKVCNFKRDCSDGEDERACGACRFTSSERSDAATSSSFCGLTFETDPLLEWTWDLKTSDTCQQCTSEGGAGTMSVVRSPGAVQTSIKHSATIKSSGQKRSYQKARVLFPRLRPTDNKNCAISIRQMSLESRSQMSLVILEPRDLETSKEQEVPNTLKLLNTTSQDGHSWQSFGALIGEQLRDYWSLAILVETSFQPGQESDRLSSMGPMTFENCEPIDVDKLESLYDRPTNSRAFEEQLLLACNASDKFLCHLSGKCIERKFVCDFGRDCGSYDDSDETNCSHRLGQCDFEEGNKCGWNASSAWSLMGSNSNWLDHTYQSDLWPGHFLWLSFNNLTHTQANESIQLVGPLVQLKAGHEECSFRFWVDFERGPVGRDTAMQLRVGHELVIQFAHYKPLDDLITLGRHVEDVWRRFEVSLVNSPSGSTDAIHLTLVDFADLVETNSSLALDDFSFSDGCQPLDSGNHSSRRIVPAWSLLALLMLTCVISIGAMLIWKRRHTRNVLLSSDYRDWEDEVALTPI